MERLSLRIFGRVQGVFFRQHTQETARELGLSGWVRNADDGAVEVVAEGARPVLDQLRAWCSHGPPHAHVLDIEERWSKASGEFHSFSIIY